MVGTAILSRLNSLTIITLFYRGFAVGWDYAIGWLTVLPFELIAASITIQYWNSTLNVGIFIAIFLVALCLVQIFGVRGYGEGAITVFCLLLKHGY